VYVYKIRLASLFLPVITQVINLLNGIKRHHLLFNTVGQNRCPLIFDNNHSKFSVICVRFMYKFLALCLFFPFLIWRRLSFLKTFLVTNIFKQLLFQNRLKQFHKTNRNVSWVTQNLQKWFLFSCYILACIWHFDY